MRRQARVVRLTADQQRLVVQFRGLAVNIGRKIFGNRIPEDAIAEGLVGLCRAAGMFDPERGFKFVTYASWWVMAFEFNYLLRRNGVVSFDSSGPNRRAFFGFGRAQRRLERMGKEATPEALAEALGIPVDTVRLIHASMSGGDASLDQQLERGFELRASGPSPEEAAVEAIDHATVAEALHRAVGRLSDPRLRLIIRARWLSDQEITLQDLANQMGLSRERVRQLEADAFHRIRLILERRAA